MRPEEAGRIWLLSCRPFHAFQEPTITCNLFQSLPAPFIVSTLISGPKGPLTLSIRRPQGPPTRRNERSEWRGEADGRGRFTPYGGRPATARRREWPTAREE